MATTNATIDVSVRGQAQLDKLQTSMDRVNTVFTRFKGIIAGAAFAGFARGALQLADTVQDLADVTGVATAEVLAFQQAVQFGGGTIEKANKGLLEFFQTVNEAAGGSVKAQAAFGELGISLTDLATLSEKALFDKAAASLAQMAPGAQKAALQAEVLGKAFRNVNINPAFVQNLQAAGVEAQKTANSIARAADLNEQWERSIFKVQLAFLEAFTPLINNMAKLLEMMPSLITAFKILAAVIVTALGISAFRAVVGIVGMIARGVNLLIKNFGSLGTFIRGLGTGSTQALGKLRDMVSAVTAPLIALGVYLGFFTGEEKKATAETEANTAATAANSAAQAEAAQRQREVVSAIAEKVRVLQANTRAFNDLNVRTIDQINLENRLLGKSKQYSDVVRAQEALIARSADEVNKLREAKEALSDQERQLGLGKEYDRQIAKILELADAETTRLERAIANQNRLQAGEQLRLFGIQAQIDSNKQLQNIQDDIAKISLTEIEKKYYDIEAAARASAVAAIQAEEARRGEPLSEAEVRKYYDAAVKGSNRLRAATRQLWEQSRTFATGWRRAFDEYVDNARNAAATAERLFTKFTTGLEDALVNMARTGKFEWRGLLDTMLEELLRSQIRTTLAGIGQALGLGGMFGGGGGAGNTAGTSPNNPMYVVNVGGGNNFGGIGGGMAQGAGFGGGGGLLSGGGIGGSAGGAGGVLGTLGSVLSGVTGGIGKVASGIGNAISGVVGGIKNIFGGFFADGGRIPGGKFGIVGERGPEFIGGPANISPMGGGGATNVTYNINAVDAASFKSMIAADPSFIYAVTEQGRRGVPARR